jgi:hypothetical protein
MFPTFSKTLNFIEIFAAVAAESFAEADGPSSFHIHRI